jgi:hypothetical protein
MRPGILEQDWKGALPIGIGVAHGNVQELLGLCQFAGATDQPALANMWLQVRVLGKNVVQHAIRHRGGALGRLGQGNAHLG